MPPPQLQSSPQENISVVMGRFHAWDVAQRSVSPDSEGEGVREVSYEEALAASRQRRPARQAASAAFSSFPIDDLTGMLPQVEAVSKAKTAASAVRVEKRQKPARSSHKAAAAPTTVAVTVTGTGTGTGSSSSSNLKTSGKDLIAPRAQRRQSSRSKANPVKASQRKATQVKAGQGRAAQVKAGAGRKVEAAPPATAAALPVVVLRTRRTPAVSKQQAIQQQTLHPKSQSAAPASARQVTAESVKQSKMRRSAAPAKEARQPQPAMTASENISKPASRIQARKSAAFRSALAACLKEAPRDTSSIQGANVQGSQSQASPGKHASRKNRMQEHLHAASQMFRKAPATAALIASAKQPRKAAKGSRMISINLRLSQLEHERMSKAAVEADVSLAAYIRQSTLEFQTSSQQKEPANPRQKITVRSTGVPGSDPFALYDRPIPKINLPNVLARMKNFWLGRRLTAIA